MFTCRTPILVSPGPGSSGQAQEKLRSPTGSFTSSGETPTPWRNCARRQAVERVGDHAVVHEDRAIEGRADGELQIDVLQDAQVTAERPVLDAVDAGIDLEAHLLDARAIQLEAAQGRVAAGEEALDLGQQRRAAERDAVVEPQPVAQRQPRASAAPPIIEWTPTLMNVSSPMEKGSGRSGTDSTGSATSAIASRRKPRVGTRRLSRRSHSMLNDRLPTVVPSWIVFSSASGPCASQQRLGVRGVAQVVVNAGVDARVHLAREADRAAARVDVAQPHRRLLQVQSDVSNRNSVPKKRRSRNDRLPASSDVPYSGVAVDGPSVPDEVAVLVAGAHVQAERQRRIGRLLVGRAARAHVDDAVLVVALLDLHHHRHDGRASRPCPGS